MIRHLHLIHLLIFSISVLVTAKVVPGIKVKSFGSAFIFAVVLAILNKLLYGVLVFFSFPMILVTFGLFLLVINAALWLLADKLTSGVEIDGWGSAILGSIVTSGVNWLIFYVVR